MLALCVGITSCEEPIGPQETLVKTTQFNLPQEGGSVEVKFTPFTSWSISCDSDFITIDPTSGDASEEEVVVTVTVAPNEGEARTASLVVSFIWLLDFVLACDRADSTQ